MLSEALLVRGLAGKAAKLFTLYEERENIILKLLAFLKMNMCEGETSVAQEFIPVLDLEEKKVLDNLRIITG